MSQGRPFSTPIVTVQTSDAPRPAGHYAQALSYGGLIFVSGQLPVTLEGHTLANAPFEAQADQAFTNLLNILAAAGAGPADVLKLSAYVVGVANWPVLNEVCARRFGAARPARVVVPVPELHYGYLVEVDAIARRPE
jgi:reactive intermediate/imine deaminase